MNIEGLKEIKLDNLKPEDKWILTKYEHTLKAVTKHMDKYEFNLAGSEIYDFAWNVFCDYYIENEPENCFVLSDDGKTVGYIICTENYDIYKDLIYYDIKDYTSIVNKLIKKGYNAVDINNILKSGSYDDILIFLERDYLENISDYLKHDFSNLNNLDRYLAYKDENNIDNELVVVYVNIGLDNVTSKLAEVQEQNETVIEQNETVIEQNEEAESTRKGIWQTIKDLPNAFLDMLKSLIVPEDEFFSNWFDDLKAFFEKKLGFLATPFTLIIDFINYYLDLDSSADIIINIPDITVPNFEEYVLIEATSFNWSQLLNSKDALKTLWILYLDFIDVFLILNFIGLCERVYARIFGGDTSNYEYYTVEDSYIPDYQSGELKFARRTEKTTTRKEV